MRVKTDERRQAIMAAAAEIFRERGFERASMSAIAVKAGSSKATVYNYFPSKEELFADVMLSAVDEEAAQMVELLKTPEGPVSTVLEAFGYAYMELRLSPQVLAVNRIGITAGTGGNLGPLLYAKGPEKGWKTITERLQMLADQGILNLPNPSLAAYQFKALLETGTVDAHLFGATPPLEVKETVRSAVAIFLQIYGTATNE